MTPPWIDPKQWQPLSPPAHVLVLGETRSASNYLAALRSLCVLSASRYAPRTVTWCNIFLSDGAQILRAPIPHVFDLGDGKGPRELRANDIVDGMRAGKFPGWRSFQHPSPATKAIEAANRGEPTIAVWKNQTGGPGHVVFVVPVPSGGAGVYVTGAGRLCLYQAPIERAFGALPTEFFTHD